MEPQNQFTWISIAENESISTGAGSRFFETWPVRRRMTGWISEFLMVEMLVEGATRPTYSIFVAESWRFKAFPQQRISLAFRTLPYNQRKSRGEWEVLHSQLSRTSLLTVRETFQGLG